ncbi:MAG: AAA family ATPase, partial [Actinomycetota bacterium]|nr:AAA family ATPase [Actinomycetota bacterium]
MGREQELQRLRAALGGAVGGDGRLVLLSGGAGVGKTRLIDELTRHAAVAGALVGWGRCHQGDSAPPFWPWIQVLKSAMAEAAVDLDSLPEPVAPALVQLVPELGPGRVPPATGAPGSLSDAPHARSQVFQALATFLVDLTGSRCLVLVVDDLHWADAPSLELFTFLAAQLGGSRLLLLGTYREADVDHDHPLCHALASLTRHPWAERLSLEGMGESEVASLVTGVTGAEPPAELVAAMHARTDGNPFFVIELLRMLEADGSLAAGDAGAVLRSPVPLGIRDVIRQRIAQLTPEARTVLTVAAVAGREFDGALLEDASGEDEDTVLSALELAVARGILTEVPGAVGRFRFSHGLIQETIYQGLNGLRRARLHARVATALEARPAAGDASGTRATDLAHHLWHALPAAGTATKAVRYALAAADRAVEQLAYERAQEQLERALELVASLPPDEAPLAELAAQTRLGRLLTALRGHAAPEVRTAFSRARTLCEAAGTPPSEQISARWGLFYSLYIGGDMAGAERVGNELLALAESGPVPKAALAGHLAVGIASFHVGSLTAARSHLEASINLGQTSPDRGLAAAFEVDPQVYARCFLALVLGLTGEVPEAATVAAQARALAGDLGHPFSAATASLFSAWLGFIVADSPTALRHGAETISVSTRYGFRLLAAAGAVFEGWALAHEHDPSTGSARLREAVRAFEALGSPLGQLLFRVAGAEVAHLDGRGADAVDTLRQLIERQRAGGSGHYYDAELHRLYAEILLSNAPDAAAEAHEHLHRAVDLARSHGAHTLE